MKILLISMTAVLLSMQAIFAQEDSAPSAAPAPVAPTEQLLDLIPSEMPRLPADSVPLIPEQPVPSKKSKKRTQPLPSLEEPGKVEKTKTEVAEEELRGRIRFREAKTKAIKDPAIQVEWERAHAARTDYAKREAMKKYYRLLFGRMARIDNSIKPRIDAALTQSLRQLEQDRLKPTEPVDPRERDER
ncbi:MAG: hypothetical protein V4710_04870 [Verrucomicrobiota bacterium]